MKMEKYQDFMRILFDNYLVAIFWVIILVIGLGTMVALVRTDLTNTPLELIFDGFTIALMFAIGYSIIRWLVINLPAKIFKVKEHIQEDINTIHDKHS